MHWKFLVLVTLLSSVSLLGCGEAKDPVYKVTGKVTYDGTPIENGSIVFDPADGKGVSAMAGITNGEISGEVPEGEKILRINATRTLDKQDQYGEPITESYIPEKYNLKSDLKETVSSSGENNFVIDLKK